MIIKANCEMCEQCKKGERLFSYNDKVICVHCLAALMTETTLDIHSMEYDAGDLIEAVE